MPNHTELRLANTDAIKLLRHFLPALEIKATAQGLVINQPSGPAAGTFAINTAALNAPDVVTLNAFGLSGSVSIKGQSDALELTFKPKA